MRSAAAFVALVALWCVGQVVAGESALEQPSAPTFYVHPNPEGAAP